jgi:Zn-dependent alcohol dehydrogenase
MIQLAKAEGAKSILATAGTDEKTKLCESLGATHGINYKKTDWGEEVKKLAPEGVDLIVDFILGIFPKHQKLMVQARDTWREIYKWLHEMEQLYYLQCSEELNSKTLMPEQFYINDLR